MQFATISVDFVPISFFDTRFTEPFLVAIARLGHLNVAVLTRVAPIETSHSQLSIGAILVKNGDDLILQLGRF